MSNIGTILLFSARILLAVSVMNLIIGSLLGVILALHDTKGFRIIDTLISLPLVFPPIALGFFLIILFGRQGIIGLGLYKFFNINVIFSALGVFIAAQMASFSLMTKSVKAAASVLNKSMIEMAAIQGAGRWQTIYLIIIPNIKTGILTGLALSSGRALGEVGMTLLLGGNISGRTETISLAIFNAVFEGNFQRAGLLSTLLAMIAIGLFMVIQQMEKDERQWTRIFSIKS
jgi:molybdate transport system permease protein